MSDAGRELWGFTGVYTLEAKCCFYNIFRYDLASLYPNKMSRRKWWIARSCCPWTQNSQVVVKHRMDSESSLGWKGPLNIILFKLPAMRRDIFNQSRLFRDVQPLGWSPPPLWPTCSVLHHKNLPQRTRGPTKIPQNFLSHQAPECFPSPPKPVLQRLPKAVMRNLGTQGDGSPWVQCFWLWSWILLRNSPVSRF